MLLADQAFSVIGSEDPISFTSLSKFEGASREALSPAPEHAFTICF